MQPIEKLYRAGEGVLRLAPTWVPRVFCRPGRRLRLHPDDYYALGMSRGGIDERWFASTVQADNGPGTPEDEGLSYIVSDDGSERVLLRDAVAYLGAELIGPLWDTFHRWPAYAKFFDNAGPLPHHIHHNDAFAARVGACGKPEMYFYPAQYNPTGGEFPFSFFGLRPETTREELRQALMDFTRGDNHILDLSVGYKLTLDTGWDIAPGILHAPGSLCTYEPQFASDVFAMYQSLLYFDHTVSSDLLWKNCPPEEVGNFDYLMDAVDWDANTDPYFSKHHFMRPRILTSDAAHTDEAICYLSPVAGAKRLTVNPGCSAAVTDPGAYGLICVQGHGSINGRPLEAPTMMRYGQLTYDEYFVAAPAAEKGVMFKNNSPSEPLVILKHFAQSLRNV